jgi:hypothetical protein
MQVRVNEVRSAHIKLCEIARSHKVRLVQMLETGERDYSLLLGALNDYIAFQRAADVIGGYATIAKSDLVGAGRDAARLPVDEGSETEQ